MEHYAVASNELTDNKMMVSWKNSVEIAINKLKDEGFDFSQISQMNIVIVCNRMDMTYDFYVKHNMPAVERKLSQLLNKDKT